MRKALIMIAAAVALVGVPAIASAYILEPPPPPPPPPDVIEDVVTPPPPPPEVAPIVVTPPPPPAVLPAPVERPRVLQRAMPVTGTDLVLPALMLAGLLMAAGAGLLVGARRRLATLTA